MKKKLKKLILPAITVCLCCLLTLAVHLNTHRFFLLFEELGWFREEIEISAADEGNRFVDVSIDALTKDPSVTFDQSMMLINPDHPLPESFIPDVLEYKDTDVYMSRCMLEAYAALSAHISEKFGTKLYVSSDLRTYSEQEELYRDDPNTATLPGASEHQSGLALDVYVAKFAGDGFIKSPAGRFINSNARDFGFIIRYPSYGEDTTGIRFEPWHIRFVGQPHAKVIYGNMLTLEEYILSFDIDKWYEIDGYLVSRQRLGDSNTFSMPESFESCIISPDNTGAYIITVKK